MGANQLAVVAGEPMAAGGADLAVVSTASIGRAASGRPAPLCEISAADSGSKVEFRARGSSGNMPDRLAWR